MIQDTLRSVAIALQRGTAMAYLEGYDRALRALGEPESQEEEEEDERHEENEEAEGEEEEEYDEVKRAEDGGEDDGVGMGL